jgi:hypothetical protein
MPPTPWQTEIRASGIWAGAVPRIWRTLSCSAYMPNRLMPWDHAAGWLLHHEAGGYSAHFDGATYHPTHFSGGLIYAPDEASWHLARAALLGQ